MRSTFPGSFEYFQKIPSTFKFPGLKNHCENKTKQNMLDTYTFWSYFYCCCWCLYFVLFFVIFVEVCHQQCLMQIIVEQSHQNQDFSQWGHGGCHPTIPVHHEFFQNSPPSKQMFPMECPHLKLKPPPPLKNEAPFHEMVPKTNANIKNYH